MERERERMKGFIREGNALLEKVDDEGIERMKGVEEMGFLFLFFVFEGEDLMGKEKDFNCPKASTIFPDFSHQAQRNRGREEGLEFLWNWV